MYDRIEALCHEMDLHLHRLDAEQEINLAELTVMEETAERLLTQVKTFGINSADAQEMMELGLIEKRSLEAFSQARSHLCADEVGLELEAKASGGVVATILLALSALLAFIIGKFFMWAMQLGGKAVVGSSPGKGGGVESASTPREKQAAEAVVNGVHSQPIDRLLGKGINKKYRLLTWNTDYISDAKWVEEVLREAKVVLEEAEKLMKEDLTKVGDLRVELEKLTRTPPKAYHSFIKLADKHFGEFYTSAWKPTGDQEDDLAKAMRKWNVKDQLTPKLNDNRLTLEYSKTIVMESDEVITDCQGKAKALVKAVDAAEKTANRSKVPGGVAKKAFNQYRRLVAVYPLMMVSSSIKNLILPYLGEMAKMSGKVNSMVKTIYNRVQETDKWLRDQLLNTPKLDPEHRAELEGDKVDIGRLLHLASQYGIDTVMAPGKTGTYLRKKPAGYADLVAVIIEDVEEES